MTMPFNRPVALFLLFSLAVFSPTCFSHTAIADTGDITIRVAESYDDAEEHKNGHVHLNRNHMDLGDTGWAAGIRFSGVTIAKGAEILEAHIEFSARMKDHKEAALLISGEASDHSEAFSDEHFCISGRPVTAAAAEWHPPVWEGAGERHQSPDLSAVIQEIINREGWREGNAMAFIITGNGRRRAVTHDKDPSLAPLLRVRYRTAGDVIPPSGPQTLTASSVTAYSVSLEWDAATDDTGVAGYEVFRDGVPATSTPDTAWSDASATPETTYTYTVKAFDAAGNRSEGASITVVTPPESTPSPLVFSASADTIAPGEPVLLSWASAYETVSIDHGIGPVPSAGSATVSPAHTTTYTITAADTTGTASTQATVFVIGPPPAPQPPDSFGEAYEDLIPPDSVKTAYDPIRFAVITGLVQTPAGDPIEGVSVTVHGAPEYGTAETDDTGRYSMPVEGGAIMAVVFKKPGLITTQRQVEVPWNNIAVPDTVTLIAEDPAATDITFDGNAGRIMTHRGTPVTDTAGTRACTLVFTGDNRAFLTDKDGNDVMELKKITVRATEYATPEAMPAELPPTSAYTYCVELAADGVSRVRFEKPVVAWVDNFLGFDVGMIVPVGYFDRDKGVWVPADNGVVVRLLDTDGDGRADALDADGDGQPDDLDGDGIFTDEIEGLEDPERYPAGETFWRVDTPHFTPWDHNWPTGPPEDAEGPDEMGDPEVDDEEPQPKGLGGCTSSASYTVDRSRIFHEDIPVPGTDFALHYASSRVPGFKYAITVPASGDTVPDGLEAITVTVSIAGRRFSRSLEPLPNQTAVFYWDGLDYRGNPARSSSIYVYIGFQYPAYYYYPLYKWDSVRLRYVRAFGNRGTPITNRRARAPITLRKSHYARINPPESKGMYSLAEGWTLTGHHQVDDTDDFSPILYKGDGTSVRQTNSRYKSKTLFYDSVPETVAGTGTAGDSGDGGQAVEAALNYPEGVCFDADGNLYIADRENHRIRKMDREGIITTVAGTGVFGFTGDGGPAADARLDRPADVAVDGFGNIYIADSGNQRIRKVDTAGIITTVAGAGMCSEWIDDGYGGHWYASPCSDGDGGKAVDAHLYDAAGIAVDEHGTLWIATGHGNRVRKVSPDGLILTVAGDGTYGSDGDGGQAVDARLNEPVDIALDMQGCLYIAERLGHRIRKIDIGGLVSTVAGTGAGTFCGDGGPAAAACLNRPAGIAVGSEGTLYISDGSNRRIRGVSGTGIINTIAGNGEFGNDGDGMPATRSRIASPAGLATDPTGYLYIASDSSYSTIRRLGPARVFKDVFRTWGNVFVENNGLGHIITSSLHDKTIDLDTGTVLYDFDYNDERRLAAVTDRFGNVTGIERDAGGRPTAIISPDGDRTELLIDDHNQLIRVIYPDGGAFSFEYDHNDGLLTAKIEPEGNRYPHVFDADGRLTDITDEEGGHWQYTRNRAENGDHLTKVMTAEGNFTTYLDHTGPDGDFTSVTTSPDGGKTTFSQSADGLVAASALACGTTVESTYDVDPEYGYRYLRESIQTTESGLNRVTERSLTYQDTNGDRIVDVITGVLTVNGKTARSIHDIHGNRKTAISPEGRQAVSDYNIATLQTERMTVPGLLDTTYEYYDDGRLKRVLTGTRESFYTHDAMGNLSASRDPEGRVTAFEEYDGVGRVLKIRRPDNSVVRFAYDLNGNMTVLTNPSAVDHGFGFNRVNRNDAYITPESGGYAYLYDRDRRLVETRFPSGLRILNAYDNGRLDAATTPEGIIVYDYYCGSKVKSVTMGAESILYGYDASLITSVTLSGILNQTLGFAWNNDFALESFTYAGDTEAYAYDDDGLVTGAGRFAITRNAENGLPESVQDVALTLERTFNGYGETDAETYALPGNTLYSYEIAERDNAGRILRKTETAGGVTTTSAYTYDAMGRLLTVTRGGVLSEEYRYNENGARIYEMNAARGIVGLSLTYSDEDHLLTAGEAAYSYDPDGFLTSRTVGTETTAYDYSSRGELLGVTLADGALIQYIHDPLDRRIAKKVNGAVTEKYLWSGPTTLLAVYDGAGSLRMRFEYADGRMPLAVTREGVTYYLAYDQVGSLKAVADGAGNVVKRIDYDAFGNIISDTNPLFDMPFGFAGGLHDRDTGLVRFGYRDYDPETGRWTAKDPILFAGGDTDLYGYVLNDPVNFVDPDGLIRIPGAGKAIGWGLKRLSKWVGGKIGKKVGEWADFWNPEIANPTEQQDMEKDTDGDGINDYWDHDDNDGIPDAPDSNSNESPCK